ncbi:MAG: hypothetical protein KJ600_00910 [Nanoarchaeota archaeon]|nr:hypothetical protein [Nanoarchaeota archaeon]MBU1103102.1 hypothetical protein [Nanoarchaeota archaeon]
MKKGEILGIVLIVVLVLGFVYFFNPSGGDVLLAPYVPPILSNCSDEDAIKAVWDEAFGAGSSGITIVTSTSSSQICEHYFAYDLADGSFLGGVSSVSGSENFTRIIAVRGMFSGAITVGLKALTSAQVGNNRHIDLLNLAVGEPLKNAEPRSVGDVIIFEQDAVDEFSSIFPMGNASGFANDSDADYFEFSYFSPDETVVGGWNFSTEISMVGGVHVYNKTSYFVSSETNEFFCTPNWTTHNTSCGTSETFVIWHEDLNDCPGASKANETGYCDYDGNGLIGTESEITDDHLDIELYIDDDRVDSSENYSGTELVELIDDDDVVRVEFDHDFSAEPLNLKLIEVKIQGSSSDFGYIIVSGIDDEKEVRVDRVAGSGEVCVEDKEIDDIGDIDEDCDTSGEYSLSCPGSKNSFDCSISGGFYIVDDLDHSGVRELLEDDYVPPICIPDWSCSSWSDCVSGEKTQTCTDLNYCGNLTGKPDETDTCVVPGCVPDWSCGDWGDCSGGEKTRTCSDLNNCGTASGKPVQTKDCEGSSVWFIAGIIAAAIFILGVVALLVKLLWKEDERPSRVQQQVVRPQVRRQPQGFYRKTHYLM